MALSNHTTPIFVHTAFNLKTVLRTKTSGYRDLNRLAVPASTTVTSTKDEIEISTIHLDLHLLIWNIE